MKDWPPTTWVAIYAAIVSTVALLWNVMREFVFDRSRVRINADVRDLVAIGGGGTVKKDVLFIEVTNVGRVPVTISGIGGKYDDGKKFMIIPNHTRLPKRLERGERMQEMSEDRDGIHKMQTHLNSLECWDTYGRYHRMPKKALKKLRRQIAVIARRNEVSR